MRKAARCGRDEDGDDRLDTGEDGRRVRFAQVAPELQTEVVADRPHDGDGRIDEGDQHKHRPVRGDETPALVAIHGPALAAAAAIGGGRRRRGPQERDRRQQRQEEDEAHEHRHPELADAEIDDHPLADRLDDAGRQDEARAQGGRQRFGLPTSLEIGEDQSEDHAERQAVDEHSCDLPRQRQKREADESRFRDQDQADDRSGTMFPANLRDDLDADELRQRVAGELGEDRGRLEVDAEHRLAVVGSCGEGAAEGVHAEIRAERRGGGEQGEVVRGIEFVSAERMRTLRKGRSLASHHVRTMKIRGRFVQIRRGITE